MTQKLLKSQKVHILPKELKIDTARLSRIDTLLQGYVDRKELPGMLAAVHHRGHTVYRQKFGMMDIEANKPMQYDAIFRIASMTKPITSVAMMLLYEEGHFHLNTPLYEFIPEFRDTMVLVGIHGDEVDVTDLKTPVTLRHLFTHTSGLAYGFNEEDELDQLYQKKAKELEESEEPVALDRFVVELAKLPLAFQPGTEWRYGLNIDVLGRVVEVISGKSLDQFFQERIFKPLGMVDTAFYVPEQKLNRVATLYGHTNGDDELQRVDWNIETTLPNLLMGGGGLYSTFADYERFAEMLLNKGELNGIRLLSPKTAALMELNHAPAEALPYAFSDEDINHMGYGYGLGMRVLMDVALSGQAGSVGEFGWDGAFNTYFWIDRKEELYGLFMVQHQPAHYYPVARQFKIATYQALVD